MIASILAGVAPSLFRLLEKRLGPKTGSAKMQTAVSVAETIFGALATAGKIDGAAPSSEIIRSILEGMLAEEKQKPDWHEQGVADIAGRRFIVEVISEVK